MVAKIVAAGGGGGVSFPTQRNVESPSEQTSIALLAALGPSAGTWRAIASSIKRL